MDQFISFLMKEIENGKNQVNLIDCVLPHLSDTFNVIIESENGNYDFSLISIMFTKNKNDHLKFINSFYRKLKLRDVRYKNNNQTRNVKGVIYFI